MITGHFLPVKPQIYNTIALMLIIWSMVQIKFDRNLKENMKRALMVTCIVGILIVFVDVFVNIHMRTSWLAKKAYNHLLIEKLFTIKYLLLIIFPVSTLYVVGKEEYRKSNTGIFVWFIISAYSTVLIFNLFYPILFSVTENGKYIHEDLWWVRVLILFCTYSLTIGIAFKKKYAISNQERINILMLLHLFVVGVYYAEIEYYADLTGLFTSIGLVFVVNIFQSFGAKICQLTGLPTMDILFSDIGEGILDGDETVYIFSILGLKGINRAEGRKKGDYYLRAVAKTLADELQPYGKVYKTFGNGVILVGSDSKSITAKISELDLRQYTSKKYGVYPMNFVLAKTLPVEQKRSRVAISSIIAACDNAED